MTPAVTPPPRIQQQPCLALLPVPLLWDVWRSWAGPIIIIITITLVQGQFDGTSVSKPGSLCSVTLWDNEELLLLLLLQLEM